MIANGWRLYYYRIFKAALDELEPTGRRVKKGMPDRYRLFFRFASNPVKVIVYVWFNDENTLRNAGSKTDVYVLLHSICATLGSMKTAQLPPVRVEPTVREEIESVLLEGESLSQFVETATVLAARRRKAQQAFLARGRASLANAKANEEFYPLHGVLDQMRARLDARMDEQRRARRLKSKKP